jgi:molecular chaperone DnaK
VLGGEVKEVLLLDVTPLSLGIETLGGVMTVLIPRNTTIPTRKSEIFSTAADNQSSVEVHVLQGERPLARDNRTLGRFHLEGIPPAPRGIPQIEVTFDVDANGIVNVSAKDMASGKEQKIAITASSGLSKEEVERMVKEAQSHAAEDEQRRALIDARNEADALAYTVEKRLNEVSGQLPADARAPVESAIARARKVTQEDDLQAIRQAIDELQGAARSLAETAARAQQAAGSARSGGQSDVVEGEVIDAEPVESQRRR